MIPTIKNHLEKYEYRESELNGCCYELLVWHGLELWVMCSWVAEIMPDQLFWPLVQISNFWIQIVPCMQFPIYELFLNFPACFWIPIFFSSLNSNCSNLLDMRNRKEQVKKAFCYQKLFWPVTVQTNCSSDFRIFENSRPSASNFKSFSQSLEQFFLTVGQNNFDNKIPFLSGKQHH